MRRTACIVILAASWISPARAAGEVGAVRRVTLFSGGVAEVVRGIGATDGGVVELDVPATQVDDVLKSLVIRDPAGGPDGVAIAEPGPGLAGPPPFERSDLTSLPSVLARLTGARIRLTTDRAVEGVLLGVRPAGERERDGDEPGPAATVVVLEASGRVRSVPVGDDASFEILDGSAAGALATAATDLSRDGSEAVRRLRVDLADGPARDVEFDYVVAAPVWKASHRLVVAPGGKGRMQTWAVVENGTGEDWKGVSVSLSSGSPVTLRQELSRPHWRERPVVPVLADAPPPAAADVGAVPSPPAPLAFRSPEPAADVAAIAPAEPFAMTVTTSAAATSGDVSTTFALPDRIDLPAGATLAVPVIDATLPADRIAVFAPGGGDPVHPTAAVTLSNVAGSALPGGVVTVYDAGGFVGDATLGAVPKGAERIVRFAVDGKLRVGRTERPEELVRNVRVADGRVVYEAVSRRRTDYAAANSGAEARTLVVEHPKRPGWTLSSASATSQTPDAWRLRGSVPAGGEVVLSADETFAEERIEAVGDVGGDRLIALSGSAPDAATAEKLRGIAAARSRSEEIRRRLEARRTETEAIYRDQERIRGNLSAVGTGDLRDVYLGKLTEQERRIEDAQAAVAADEKALAEAEAVTRDLISRL